MKVSVLVCTYGDENWQRAGDEALEHEIHRTDHRPAFELVRVHEQQATLAAVRNEAAQKARGDWLCFVDADDRLGVGYLEAMSLAFMQGAITADWAPLLVPSVQYVNEDGSCRGEPVIPDWGRSLFDLNCAVVGTLVKRDTFLRVGGFREWTIYEDWDLWLRIVRDGAQMVAVPDAVYCAGVRSRSRNTPDANAARVYAEIRAEHADVDPDVWARAKCPTPKEEEQ